MNSSSFVACHSGSGVVPLSTADNLKNAELSILASLSDICRMTKAGTVLERCLWSEGNNFTKRPLIKR